MARELRKVNQENESGSQWLGNESAGQWRDNEGTGQWQDNEDSRFSKTVQKVVWGLAVLCVLGFFGYIAVIHFNHPYNKVQRQVKQWEAFKRKQGLPSVGTSQKPSETNTVEGKSGNFRMNNCMFDDQGNLLVMGENGYEPYTFNALPNIPANLYQIVQALDDGENELSLDYIDQKLFLYYGLESSKSQIVGGNDVDIINFHIDREEDIITFSIESLTFPDYFEDDYRPHLLTIFNFLFGESGQKIYDYLMTFYGKGLEVETQDETLIDGMRVSYRFTPKHKLTITLK